MTVPVKVGEAMGAYVLAAVVVAKNAPAPPIATMEVAVPPAPPVPTPMNSLSDASEYASSALARLVGALLDVERLMRSVLAI